MVLPSCLSSCFYCSLFGWLGMVHPKELRPAPEGNIECLPPIHSNLPLQYLSLSLSLPPFLQDFIFHDRSSMSTDFLLMPRFRVTPQISSLVWFPPPVSLPRRITIINHLMPEAVAIENGTHPVAESNCANYFLFCLF